MNLYQVVNVGANALVLGGVVGGLLQLSLPEEGIWTSLLSVGDSLLLLLFVLVFRSKVLMDDHKYFGGFSPDKETLGFPSLILAVGSAVVCAVAAYTVNQPVVASVILVVSIGILEIWVFAHLLELWYKKRELDTQMLREGWFVFNLLYIGSLLTFSQTEHWAPLVVLFAVMLIDVMISRPDQDLEEA